MVNQELRNKVAKLGMLIQVAQAEYQEITNLILMLEAKERAENPESKKKKAKEQKQ